jgi:hypothetical protein
VVRWTHRWTYRPPGLKGQCHRPSSRRFCRDHPLRPRPRHSPRTPLVPSASLEAPRPHSGATLPPAGRKGDKSRESSVTNAGSFSSCTTAPRLAPLRAGRGRRSEACLRSPDSGSRPQLRSSAREKATAMPPLPTAHSSTLHGLPCPPGGLRNRPGPQALGKCQGPVGRDLR